MNIKHSYQEELALSRAKKQDSQLALINEKLNAPHLTYAQKVALMHELKTYKKALATNTLPTNNDFTSPTPDPKAIASGRFQQVKYHTTDVPHIADGASSATPDPKAIAPAPASGRFQQVKYHTTDVPHIADGASRATQGSKEAVQELNASYGNMPIAQAKSVEEHCSSFSYAYQDDNIDITKAKNIDEASASFGHVEYKAKRGYKRKYNNVDEPRASFGSFGAKARGVRKKAGKFKGDEAKDEEFSASFGSVEFKEQGQSKSVSELCGDETKAFNYMVRLLTKREHSLFELRDKAKRYYQHEAIEKALEKCLELGYQSEERYAQMLIRHMEYALYGPRKLMMEAKRKGVDINLIMDLAQDVDWEQIALLAVEKKYKDSKLDYKQRSLALAYLMRRGFNSDTCVIALDKMRSKLEN